MNTFNEPYLLQRCTIKSPYLTGQRVGDWLTLDYMGSAEFEFGAFPKASRLIHSRLDKLVVEQVKFSSGAYVWILALPDQVEPYRAWLKQFETKTPRTKELTYLEVVAQKQEWPSYLRGGIDIWVDIDNGVVISQHKYPLQDYKDAVVESVKYMDAQKGKN